MNFSSKEVSDAEQSRGGIRSEWQSSTSSLPHFLYPRYEKDLNYINAFDNVICPIHVNAVELKCKEFFCHFHWSISVYNLSLECSSNYPDGLDKNLENVASIFESVCLCILFFLCKLRMRFFLMTLPEPE